MYLVGTTRIGPEAPPRAGRLAGGALLGGGLTVALVLALASSGAPRPSSAASHNAFARLPMPAKALISRTVARDDRSFAVTPAGGGLAARNAPHHLVARFSRHGVLVRSGSAHVGLSLDAYGYGRRLRTLAQATPRADHNQVTYRHPALSEGYANGPLGLAQGFTLKAPPAAHRSGPLTLALGLSGNLRASLARGRGGLSLGRSLRYSGLSASDASGRSLRTWLELHGRTVLLRVDDAGARYPLKIDPFLQQAKLTASDQSEQLGFSVAVSGNTVVAGAPNTAVGANTGQGAAYVFVKPTSGWANATPTAKLTAADGVADDHLGHSVAISGDTVVAGAPSDPPTDQGQGAAYVFVKPTTGWTNATETAKLTASDGAAGDFFGGSVGVDGDTVVAGAGNATVGANSKQGAVYVFVKPTTGWTNATETAKLTVSGGAAHDLLGDSVAISGDTVVAGAIFAKIGTVDQGAAYVFVKPTTGWTNATQTDKLTASDGAANDQFGFSVAVSGSTVVVGSPAAKIGANAGQGAAYVFGEAFADLAITKSVSPNPPVHGQQFSYTITVTNNGPDDATGVKVTDPLPAVRFDSVTSSQGSCSRTPPKNNKPTDGTIRCDLGTLANGAGATITIVMTATGKPGPLTNTATVTADQKDPNQANNSATVTTTDAVR